MRLLFISSKDVKRKSNGGELCTNRNYLSFCSLLGEENVKVINLLDNLTPGAVHALKKRLNYLRGLFWGLSGKVVRDLLHQAKDYDLVFIDSSIHGVLASALKKSGYGGRIISFFHNVEYRIQSQKLRIKPWKLAEVLVVQYNERMACRHADQIIALNSRDSKELERIYGARNVDIIPISLTDQFEGDPEGEQTTIPPTFIFTGNNWYANLHGLDWFISNVLNEVDITLQITGYKMDELRDRYIHPKIDFLGFVKDLPAAIRAADYVLAPVFIGSGMKVKTCEALMYGKNIVGTTESFEGYDVDFNRVGARCDTKEEFIEAIRRLSSEKRDKFNHYSRSRFLDFYSFDATLKLFRKYTDVSGVVYE
ncbi:MAG: glycosyltransferase [Bacteroidota bacterium]